MWSTFSLKIDIFLQKALSRKIAFYTAQACQILQKVQWEIFLKISYDVQ